MAGTLEAILAGAGMVNSAFTNAYNKAQDLRIAREGLELDRYKADQTYDIQGRQIGVQNRQAQLDEDRFARDIAKDELDKSGKNIAFRESQFDYIPAIESLKNSGHELFKDVTDLNDLLYEDKYGMLNWRDPRAEYEVHKEFTRLDSLKKDAERLAAQKEREQLYNAGIGNLNTILAKLVTERYDADKKDDDADKKDEPKVKNKDAVTNPFKAIIYAQAITPAYRRSSGRGLYSKDYPETKEIISVEAKLTPEQIRAATEGGLLTQLKDNKFAWLRSIKPGEEDWLKGELEGIRPDTKPVVSENSDIDAMLKKIFGGK